MTLSAFMALASISMDMYLPALPARGTAFQTGPGRVLSSFLVGLKCDTDFTDDAWLTRT